MQQTKPGGLSWGGVYDRPSAYGPTSIWGVKPSFARMVTNKCFVFCLNKCHIFPNWGGGSTAPLTPPRPVRLWSSNFIGLVIGLTHGSNLWVKPIMGKTCLFCCVPSFVYTLLLLTLLYSPNLLPSVWIHVQYNHFVYDLVEYACYEYLTLMRHDTVPFCIFQKNQ